MGRRHQVMATFVANFDAALYKLYVVDPSEQNIMVALAAKRRLGLPGEADAPPADRPARWTASPTCSSTATSSWPRTARWPA